MWKYRETDELYHGEDELYHYGVIGMRWRFRKAQQNGEKYVYKSHAQRKWANRVNKLKSEGKNSEKLLKAKNKLAMYKERDDARVRYVNKTDLAGNVGKGIVKNLLLGGYGSGAYSRLRASGMGRLGSTLLSGMPITSKIIENHAAKQRVLGSVNKSKKKKKK